MFVICTNLPVSLSSPPVDNGDFFDYHLHWLKAIEENPDHPILILKYEDAKQVGVQLNFVDPSCAAHKRMAAPRRFMFFFCGRGKVGGDKFLRDESFESFLTEQRCSVPCVTSCFNCQTFRLLTRRLWLKIFLAHNLRLCV